MASVAAFAFVNDGNLLGDMRARPMPALEAVFDGFAAMVAVEIGAAFPRYVRLLHLDLDRCPWGNGLPMVTALRIQLETAVVEQFGRQYDLALHPPTPWDAQTDIALFDVDDQPVLVPTHRAWSDLQAVALLGCFAHAPLGHDPARALAIKRDVKAAMVDGDIAARLLVIRRKDAADKAYDR